MWLQGGGGGMGKKGLKCASHSAFQTLATET